MNKRTNIVDATIDELREENEQLRRENAELQGSLNMLRNAIDSAVCEEGD